jgi:hypothetical protein
LRGNKKRRRHLAALCREIKNTVATLPHFAGRQETPFPPSCTLHRKKDTPFLFSCIQLTDEKRRFY